MKKKFSFGIKLNFKEKKILRQSYNIIKQVKDIQEKDRPKLVIDEKDLENYLKSQK